MKQREVKNRINKINHLNKLNLNNLLLNLMDILFKNLFDII